MDGTLLFQNQSDPLHEHLALITLVNFLIAGCYVEFENVDVILENWFVYW